MSIIELAMQSPFNFINLVKANKISKEDFLQTRIWEQEDKQEFLKEVLAEVGSIMMWLEPEDLSDWKFKNLKFVLLLEQKSSRCSFFTSYAEIVQGIIERKLGVGTVYEALKYFFRDSDWDSSISMYAQEGFIEHAINLLNYACSLEFDENSENFVIQSGVKEYYLYQYSSNVGFLRAALKGRTAISFMEIVEYYNKSHIEPNAFACSNILGAFLTKGYDIFEVDRLVQECLADTDCPEFKAAWARAIHIRLNNNKPLDYYSSEYSQENIRNQVILSCLSRPLKDVTGLLNCVLFTPDMTIEAFMASISSYFDTCVNSRISTTESFLFNAYAINEFYPNFSFEKKIAMFLGSALRSRSAMESSCIRKSFAIFGVENKTEISRQELLNVIVEFCGLFGFATDQARCVSTFFCLLDEKPSPGLLLDMYNTIKQHTASGLTDSEIFDDLRLFFSHTLVVTFNSESGSKEVQFLISDIRNSFVTQANDRFAEKSFVIQRFLTYLPIEYKERITQRHKDVNKEEGFKTNPLIVLQAMTYEFEFIKHAVLTQESPDKCHEAAETAANAIRGGFDSINVLGNKAALQFFASKRAESNLFIVPKKIKREMFMLDLNKEGIPGLEQVNPFERGFSWSNYDAICALAQINPYGRKNAAKRFACYLITTLFRDDPELVNEKFKEAGFEEGVKSAVEAISQVVPHTNLLSDKPSILLSKIFENREVWCEYWSNKHAHIKLVVAFYSVFSSSGKVLAPEVLAQMAQVVESFKQQGLERYMDELFSHINEVNITLKNGTTLSTLECALDFVRNNDAPAEKIITLDNVVVPEEEVSARILEAGDLRALTIGEEVSCCQHIRGHARTCAEETYTNPDYCVMIVEDTSKAEATIPLAESAVWQGIFEDKPVIVIDSIESRRNDYSAVNKVGKAFEIAIKYWISQGKLVAISKTSYGMTSQVRSWLEQMFTLEEGAAPGGVEGVYSDVGSYCMYLYEN